MPSIIKRAVLSFILALTAFSLSAADATLPPYKWQKAGRGIQYTMISGQIFDCNQTISIVRYRARLYRTDVVHATGSDAMVTSAFGQAYGAVAALNGSYFDMRALTPSTFIKVDGEQLGRTRANELPRTNGVVSFNGRHMSIALSDTLSYESTCTDFYEDGLASGPVLITDGQLQDNWPSTSFYTSAHPRTIFGYDGKGWAYLIVIDGRYPQMACGATIEQCVTIAELLGLSSAINLDGGGSSALWLSTEGVLSHPSDNSCWDHQGERTIPNAIIVRRR